MKQQTAVELIIKKICKFIDNDDSYSGINLRIKIYDFIIDIEKEIIEMEKEQIIEAYCDGFQQGSKGDRILSEQYYNETYNL